MVVLAPKAYKAGEVVFQCKPLIHCIKPEFKGKFCDNCLIKSDSLMKCSKCLYMHYCTKNCQTMDWDFHKKECKLYQRTYPIITSGIAPDHPYSFKLIIRLYFRSLSDPEFFSKLFKRLNESDICLNDIKGNKNLMKRLIDKYREDCDILCEDLDGIHFQYNREELLRCYALLYSFDFIPMHCSPQTISDIFCSAFDSIGVCILINKPEWSQSCLPNVGVLKNCLNYEYRALKDIKEGEEMSQAILFPIIPNRLLTDQYLQMWEQNACQCERCRLHLDKDIDYKGFHQLFDREMHFLQLGQKTDKPEVYFRDYRLDNDFERLFNFFKKICGQNDVFCNEFIVLSLLYFALYSRHSTKPLIRQWYQQIEPSLLITHGSEHPLYKHFQTLKYFFEIQSI